MNRLLYSRVYDTITTEGRIAIDMLLADSSNSEPLKTRMEHAQAGGTKPNADSLEGDSWHGNSGWRVNISQST